MGDFLRKRWFLIVGVVAVILVGAGLAYLYSFLGGDSKPPLEQTGSYSVIEVEPAVTTALLNGSPQVFKVFFSSPVDPELIGVEIKKYSTARHGALSEVPYTTQWSEARDALLITTTENIETNMVYVLSVKNIEMSGSLFEGSYGSVLQSTEPALSNNKDLVQYLPHETATYRLSYLPDLNTYVFNFKQDPSSTVPVLEQFAQARAEAEAYIASVGVDIDTIVIEWKHY